VSLSPFPALYSAPGSDLAADAAILLAGGVAYQQLPVPLCPRWIPDHSGAHVLPRRRASGDGLVSDCANWSGQFGQMPGPEADDVGQLRRVSYTLDSTWRNIECWPTRGSGAHQCRNQRSAYRSTQSALYSKVNPADAPIMTLAADLRFVAAGQGEDAAGYQSGTEDLAVTGWVWSRSQAGKSHPWRIQAESPAQLACPTT